MTTSHRVLHIPEILSLILGYADQQTSLSSALVCKAWLEPALDELWRTIENPLVLLNLLGPMRFIEKSTRIWIYSAFILPSAWTRFDYYAHRIRYFVYDEDVTEDHIDASALAEIARTRLKLILLPRLQHLKWNSKCLNYANLFMHPRLSQFTVYIDKPFRSAEGFHEARAFLVECATRVPNLSILDLRGSFSVVRVQSQLIELLRSLKQLTKLILPRYWITSAVLGSVADLSRLNTVQWEYDIQGEGDVKDLETFQLIDPTASFLSLIDLSLEIDFTVATNLLQTSAFSIRLTSLMIRSIGIVTPTDLSHFSQLCATRCRALSTLVLELLPNKPEQIHDSYDITIETLQPLLSHLKITHFRLSYPSQLCLTDDDVEQVAQRWPGLTDLILNHDPYIPSSPRLTLASVLHLATHCPGLRELGLYLDATSPPPPIPSPLSSSSDIVPNLRNTRNIYVGLSPISVESAKPTALFLSRLCISSSLPSFNLKLYAGISWDPIFQKAISPERKVVMEDSKIWWNTVQEYLPMLVALRSEEMARLRQLEMEVEALRSSKKDNEAERQGIRLPWSFGRDGKRDAVKSLEFN